MTKPEVDRLSPCLLHIDAFHQLHLIDKGLFITRVIILHLTET